MRIEKETEVTIKVKIGYVWPDNVIPIEMGTLIKESTFRSQPMVADSTEAEEVLMNLYANVSDLLQAAEISVRDLGIITE